MEVTEAYILVNTIFSFLFYPASIILLAVIFSLLFRLFQQPGASYQRYRGILWFNYAFCGVLFIFYIATFGLTLHTLYTEVYDGEATVYYVSGRPVQYVLIVVYDLLYTIAALEILAASFVLLSTHRNYHNNSSVSAPSYDPKKNKKFLTIRSSQMPLLFLTLIATPLLLSSLFRLGYNATYLLSVAAAQPYISVTLASTIITGLALILTFSGLLAIGVKAEDPIDQFDLEQRALQEGHYAPSHAAAPGHEPYSNELNDKGVRSSEANGGWDLRDRIEGWKPSFRKGGKSGLGLRTGF